MRWITVPADSAWVPACENTAASPSRVRALSSYSDVAAAMDCACTQNLPLAAPDLVAQGR